MSGSGERLLSDSVYDRLRALLGEPGFEPGARLPAETQLAERFAVSRPVLRQALLRLRAEGLLFARKGSGNYVGALRRPEGPLAYGPLLNIPDIRSFLEFRCVLEGEAAAQAARRGGAEDLEALHQRRVWYENALEAGEPGMDEDVAFHLAVAEAAGNRFFVLTLQALRAHMLVGIRLIRELSGQPLARRLSGVRDEHARIEEAVRARDEQAARTAMTAHLKGGIARLFGP